jgi:hypothetical protein
VTDTDQAGSAEITFVEHYETALPDGDYELVTGHRVVWTGTEPATTSDGTDGPRQPAFDETYAHRQRLRVEGPRFTLPPDTVASVFPPAGGRGHYAATLPHIVLTRATLPWERLVDPTRNDGTPWLAVLLLHAADRPAADVEGRLAELAALTDPRPGIHCYPDLRFGESPTERCRVLDVPVGLWCRIAPTYDELRWLVHAREITGPTAGRSAVVVGNRRPHPNADCIAHLVSVEGMHGLLPDSGAEDLPEGDVVRVVSLASWRFASVDPAETFTGLLTGIDRGPLQLPARPDPAITRVLGLGYAPKHHHTRSGDRTVSWYRGPLVPYRSSVAAPVLQLGQPVHSPDELARLDPETGMFDVTYAAAWQLSQLLALRDRAVATALAGWKHANLAQVAVALEHAVLRERLGAVLDLSDEPGAVDARQLRDASARMLAGLDPTAAQVSAKPGAAAGRVAYHPGAHADSFVELVRDPHAFAEIGAVAPVPVEVTTWLARLRLLHGVPSAYLVPDPGVLPPGSLRFFEVDPAWIAALVEGAFAVGRTSRAVAGHDTATHADFHADTQAAPVVSGFLLESPVVAGWPRLEVRAFDDAGAELRTLRMQRLTPRLLLYLAEGSLTRVVLAEPPESLHFGFRDTHGELTKPLRSPDGTWPVAPKVVAVPSRAGPDRVVDVATLRARVGAESSADLALQLVEGVAAVAFDAGGGR